LPRDIKFSEADKKGILIWGGASSVGSVAIQIAKSLGFKVYATASSKHHVYLKSLGASDVFDYKDKKVVENIVNAVKKDGVSMNVGYDAVGSLKECMDILKALNPQGKSTLASAPPLKEDDPKVEGVEAKFVANPTDAKERDDFYEFVFNV
jgi:NADPH:quinone reductase-like Zn-dependent oxidoreductase